MKRNEAEKVHFNNLTMVFRLFKESGISYIFNWSENGQRNVNNSDWFENSNFGGVCVGESFINFMMIFRWFFVLYFLLSMLHKTHTVKIEFF